MMASLPRKFSEKIAHHQQKQAEGDAAFHQVMAEVGEVTGPPMQISLDDTHCSRINSTNSYRERGQSFGPVRSRFNSNEKRIDTSPYNIGSVTSVANHLSPPPMDSSWRRANSDSALNQSVQNPNNNLNSPGSKRRMILESQHYDRQLYTPGLEKRPRSCIDVPSRIPDIAIYPSQQDPGATQIPISGNTGSLPDLTNFPFHSPPLTSLDQDDRQSSTYSVNSPQYSSPSTVSTTSLPPRTSGRSSFGSTPPHESPGPPSCSPVISPTSPSSQKNLYVPCAKTKYLQVNKDGGYSFHNSSDITNNNNYHQVPLQHHNKSASSQPAQQSSSLQHTQTQQAQHTNMQGQSPIGSTGATTSGGNSGYGYYQTQHFLPQMSPPHQQQTHQQQQQPLKQQKLVPNSIETSSSEIIYNHHLDNLTTYRTPQGVNRPSPQSSPILNIQIQHRNGSNASPSPLSSAPPSPTSSCSSTGNINVLPYNSGYLSSHSVENALQHFEHIRFDQPVDYMESISNGAVSFSQTEDLINSVTGANGFVSDAGYFSASPQQLHYPNTSHNTMNNSHTAPNTPSSIPDIVLTDCSENQQLVRDDISNCDVDNFFSSNNLQDTLDPLDLDIFPPEGSMLHNPSGSLDPL